MGTVGPHKQPVDSSKTVNGTSSKILEYNTGRLSVSVRNLGTVSVFIAFGADAVLGQGRSIPVDSILEIEIEKDLDVWMANYISAITDGTSVNLAISETSKP